MYRIKEFRDSCMGQFKNSTVYFLTLSQLIIKKQENVINKAQRIIVNVCLAV